MHAEWGLRCSRRQVLAGLHVTALCRALRGVHSCLHTQVVELAPAGLAFLEAAFAEHDRDGDGVLSPAEQDDMFSTAPSRRALLLLPWTGSPA